MLKCGDVRRSRPLSFPFLLIRLLPSFQFPCILSLGTALSVAQGSSSCGCSSSVPSSSSRRASFRDELLSRHVAGTIFVLATATLLANLAIIVLRGYAFNLVAGWTQKENVIGLDGLSFSIMVALMWHITLFFLIVDLIFTLLLPSRDLQDGAVISFGIISIMQVPLVTFFLQNELSWSVQVWVINACNLANHADSCPAWWARIKVVSIASSSIVNALHLFLFGLAARYVHTRPATSQDMIARPFRRTHPFKHKSKSRRKTPFQPESGSLPPPTPTPLPTTYYSEESSDGGMPLRRTPSNRTSTTNPSAYPPPASPPFLSSSSDEEKQPLSLGRRASGRR